MRSSAEIKVGIVVVAALVLLGAVLYYFIGVFSAHRGYPIEVIFDRAQVRAGDEVVMAGIPVGRVEAVELTTGNRALVRVRIEEGVTLRRGYNITIVPGALLGEKFVEITPVPDNLAGPALEPGTRVRGQPYVRLEDLVADAQGLLARLTDAVESVTALANKEQMRELIGQPLASLGQAGRELGQLAQTLNQIAKETRPQARAVLANVEGVTRDLRTTSQTLARAASETQVPQEMEEIARRLRSVVERVDDIAAQFQQMATDPEMRELALGAVRNLHDTSESIRAAADSIEQGARDIPAIAASAREAAANIRDASVEIKEVTQEARTSVSQVAGRAAEAARAISELPELKTDLSVGAQYLTHDGDWWVDANFDLVSGQRLLRLGIADIGETDRFNLQLGQRFGPGRLRYGVVESEVGFGYDWPLTPWLTLSAEAFDPNDLRANVLGSWELGGSLRGWNVVTGYRGLGGGGSPALGVSAER